MGKNHAVIEYAKQQARLKQKIKEITLEVYAGIALALHRKYGWGYKRINDLFVESQLIWDECVISNVNMVQMCENETGIEIQGRI